jgi:L-lactate dehydrogenase complex protein LldE
LRVSLFVTCLVDQCWPEVGVAAVEVLRRAGCDVVFDARQTCCGQPAFNTGYRAHAAVLARRMVAVFERDSADAIVTPSGSCAAMVHHFAELLEGDASWAGRAAALAARTYELSEFLVDRLGVVDTGGRFDGRLSWHDACHGCRDLGVAEQPRALLRRVAGAELVEVDSAQSCCGFGGTFAVRYPELSVAMLDRKLEAVEAAGVDAVVSGDVGCLMQIGGRLSRRRSRVRALHLAQVLAGDGGAA